VKNHLNRRAFLRQSARIACGIPAALAFGRNVVAAEKQPWFKISLAEWSLHEALFAKRMTHLDFPKVAREDYGIDAIELVNQFFMHKAQDQEYLREFKKRCDDLGVKILLIMCDDEGNLGDPDTAERTKAVENHFKWADAAKFFGCHSIRVNAETKGVGSFEEQQDRAADGLRKLSEYGSKLGLNVIVENHGRLSSNGAWLAGTIKKVNLANCGTLPDFGNFDLGDGKQYDRYKGVVEMMPYAKAVSAKSHDFDARGNEIHTDYRKMMKIVRDAGYRGYVGIEYEGSKTSEPDGIRATKRLLEKVREELA
jgi:L-ribulose-5-phosphate 3-epimerase